MTPTPRYTHPAAVGRAVFAVATVVFGVAGVGLRSVRLLAAAGACGVLWSLWDLLWDRLLGPAGGWLARTLLEGDAAGPPPNTRPTLDDTIRLLESHLAHGASRAVEIQAAIRLEQIYRTIRKNPDRARDVLARVRGKYPDALELAERREEGTP